MDDVGGVPLELLLQDFGRPITTAVGSGLALVDQHSRLSADARNVTTVTSITASAALLRGLVAGDPLIVDGTQHVVEVPPLSAADGALLVVQSRTA
jgi:hypothetical protein